MLSLLGKLIELLGLRPQPTPIPIPIPRAADPYLPAEDPGQPRF